MKIINLHFTNFTFLGMVMFLLSLQTGLIDMEMPHRLGAMSVILFIVAASLFQVLQHSLITYPLVWASNYIYRTKNIEIWKLHTLFFVLLLQTVLEVTHPVLLALSASSRHWFNHVKVLLLCGFIFFVPAYMSHLLVQTVELDLWTMVVISSSLLTSIQVVGKII